jgi:hypothetical protein
VLGALVVFQPCFGGVDPNYGHVAILVSFKSSPMTLQIRGANQGIVTSFFLQMQLCHSHCKQVALLAVFLTLVAIMCPTSILAIVLLTIGRQVASLITTNKISGDIAERVCDLIDFPRWIS